MPDDFDPLNDHLSATYDQFDPFLRHEELHSPVVVLQPAGAGVKVIRTDPESFHRPSAVVS